MKIPFIIILILYGFLPAMGQSLYKDSIANTQLNELINFYSGEVLGEDDFRIGREYVEYYNFTISNPFFKPDLRHFGTIKMGERLFEGLDLQYDMFTDQMIYFDSERLLENRFYKIALNEYLLDEVYLIYDQDSILFRYFHSNHALDHQLKNGFYEVVYEGGTELLIQHHAYLSKKDGLDYYVYDPRQFIKIGDRYHKFKSKRSLMKLLGEHAAEVKRYIRSKNIYFRLAKKDDLSGILKYYDGLVNTRN